MTLPTGSGQVQTLLVDALTEVVGPLNVTTAVEQYLTDVTEQPPGAADVVVRPGSADEVRKVLLAAAGAGAPVTPVVAGYNVAGLTIPRRGGIVLDLTRMNRIVEVDEDAMYVVVEPGVTFEQLKRHLDDQHPDLVYSYPFAPPSTSVLANALLDGLNNLSMRHGAMGQWVNGVEAVLADGTVVRTGAGGVVDKWFARAPLPDLTGLFISTQGTTGVVTRAALQLQPRPAARARWFAFADDLDTAYTAMRALARTGSFDDVGLMTWPAAKMLFGATRDLRRADDEPFAFLFLDMTGASDDELAARKDIAQRILDDAGIETVFPVEDLVRAVPRYGPLAELPTTLDFLLDFPGGGLTWVGSYGPGAGWVDGAHKGLGVLEEHGFPPFLVARPMAGGHYFVLRFVACFDKGDVAEVERVRAVMGRLADVVLDQGYVPYKASADAAQRILARAHPGFVELWSRVRGLLDPDGRMNPGRW
ncbi:MAG TPA: FAD-binding oxidoreductase [Acidimicrobiales bacterium]|nr:FAD-binding oxidoreductase [Acidimicrobiales bacterium]